MKTPHIESYLECAHPWGEREVVVEYDFNPPVWSTAGNIGEPEHVEITRIYFMSGKNERTVTSHATPEDLERLREEILIAEMECAEAESRRYWRDVGGMER